MEVLQMKNMKVFVSKNAHQKYDKVSFYWYEEKEEKNELIDLEDMLDVSIILEFIRLSCNKGINRFYNRKLEKTTHYIEAQVIMEDLIINDSMFDKKVELFFNGILLKLENANLMDSFFACARNEKDVVELLKNEVLKMMIYDVFSNMKKYNLSCNKNRFLSGSAMPKVGLLFNYIRHYISSIKRHFDYFIQKKYKCRIFAT